MASDAIRTVTENAFPLYGLFHLLSNLSSKADVFGFADKPIHSIALPFEIKGGAYCISVSISFYREHGAGLDQLILCEDQAMYVAKQQGKNTWVVFGEYQRVLPSRRWATRTARDLGVF